MNTLRSFLMDETGSVSPRTGFASTWCICALVAVMTLFGAYFQPAYADTSCTVRDCCGHRWIRFPSCLDGSRCVGAVCLSGRNGYPCSIGLYCERAPEGEGP